MLHVRVLGKWEDPLFYLLTSSSSCLHFSTLLEHILFVLDLVDDFCCIFLFLVGPEFKT